MEVAKRARGFAMKVLYYDTVRKTAQEEKELGLEFVPDLKALLARADFISINVSLTANTRHLLSTDEFAVMKPTAVLVRSSASVS